jgi:Kyakuja-Dileera-Zisupton transposase
MDYLFFSSVKGIRIVRLVISYDIVCQWHKNLWKRMRVYEWSLHLDHKGQIQIVFLVPKFHLPAHIEYCHNNFSFNLTQYVANTDGEAPERGWSNDNDASYSTQEMGPGYRRDTLDDRFADDDHKKVIGLGNYEWFIRSFFYLMAFFAGRSLLRKIKVAVVEAAEHKEAHELLTSSMPPEDVEKWTEMVEAWEEDPMKKNPFTRDFKCEHITLFTRYPGLTLFF